MAKKDTKAEDVTIKVLPTPVEDNEPFTHYVMVALDNKGKEKGSEFLISKKGFQTYINRTAKPEGNASKHPQFRVKKKK